MTSTASTLTGTRQTQNLTVPSTQNTAPVLEFICLYTHDIRRKQKRWQDGLLRYHTFNKRVMVYEVSRNYIGDTHRRDDDAVQDGDEFELDRGVLVQVGEAVGSMEQDLTELLEKKRKPQDAGSPKRAAPTPRKDPTSTGTSIATERSTLAQPSQLRPKSLNALLGAPKGRIGRAAPPTRSPYEQRIENEEVENRPAKRQRVEAQSEQPMRPVQTSSARLFIPPTPPIETFGTSQNTNTMADRQHHKQRQSIGKKGKTLDSARQAEAETTRSGVQQPKGAVTSRPRVETLVEDAAAALGIKKAIRSAERHKAAEEAKVTKVTIEGPPKRRDKDIVRDREKVGRPTVATERPRSVQSVIEPIEIASDSEAASASEPQRERMKLQVAARKPRKKLMYRDLLPQERPVVSRSSNNNSHNGRRSSQGSAPVRYESQPKDGLTEYHQQEQDRLADRLNKVNGRQSNEGPPDLFLTQDEDDHPPLANKRRKKRSPEPRSQRPLIESVKDQPAQLRKHVEPTFPKAPSTVHNTALTLSKMDEILIPRSRTSPPATPKRIFTNTPPPAHSPLSIPKTPPAISSHLTSGTSPSITLVPSSPGFQTQAPKTPSKIPNDNASILKAITPKAVTPKGPTLKTFTPKAPTPETIPPQSPIHEALISKAATPPRPVAQPLPKPPSPIHRPFKPPRKRSLLKKSVSDTTNMGPPAPLATTRSKSALKAREPVSIEPRKDVGDNASLWGKEAWDLFGCGRDRVECSYEEFRVREGLK